MPRYIIGITGASGAPYARRLMEVLILKGFELWVVITSAGRKVLTQELEWDIPQGGEEEFLREGLGAEKGQLKYFDLEDLAAPPASGSVFTSGMVVIPCSMHTLSAIARGNSGNLLERAADVTIKEGRPLLLVPRETPLNAIHLENMLTLARLGVRIIPAMPPFYHRPRGIEDLVDALVARVLDNMGIPQDLIKPWGSY